MASESEISVGRAKPRDFGVDMFKSTLHIYIPNASLKTCPYAKQTNGFHLDRSKVNGVCSSFEDSRSTKGHDIRRHPAHIVIVPNGHRQGSRTITCSADIIVPAKNSFVSAKTARHHGRSSGSRDSDDLSLILSQLALCNVKEGLILRIQEPRATEQVQSNLIYDNNRRFRNQIKVFPGLSPCHFAETSFQVLNNTHRRYRNRVLFHYRHFKTVHHAETVFITPKLVRNNYVTTHTQDSKTSRNPCWYQTKLEFQPKNHRSVYHIRFSKGKSGISDDKEPCKFTTCYDFNSNKSVPTEPTNHRINIGDDLQGPIPLEKNNHSLEVCGENQIENQVIITNVLKHIQIESSSSNELAKHNYFTLKQNSRNYNIVS